MNRSGPLYSRASDHYIPNPYIFLGVMFFIFKAPWLYRVFEDDARNAYSSSLYGVRQYQRISYSWCFGRLRAQLDFIVDGRVLRYVVVVSVWSSTLFFHMLHSLVVSVRSSTISMRILLLMFWSSVNAARLLRLCVSSQISCSRLCMELDLIALHATFIGRLCTELDNRNT